MKKFYASLLIASLLAALAGHKAGGQSNTAAQVAPAPFGQFTSDRADESITINSAFTPDGHTVYFSKSHASFVGLTIFQSQLKGNKWSEPVVAPFSGLYRDVDPAVSPDGKRLVFASMRGSKGEPANKYSLFQITLPFSEGTTAERLTSEINNGESVLYPSFSRDGTLFFMRSVGKMTRIFRSRYEKGQYTAPEQLQLPGDTESILIPTLRSHQIRALSSTGVLA